MALQGSNPDSPWGPRRRWSLISGRRATSGKNQIPASPEVPSPLKSGKMEILFNAEYLRGLKNSEQETANHFDSYFRPRCRAMLMARGLQICDVQDAIQETFTRVLTAVSKDDIRCPEAFAGYVFQVCHNIACGIRQGFKSPYVNIDDFDIPDPSDDHCVRLIRAERQAIVVKILDDLTAKDRNLLRAKLFDELSTEEMCARFGVSRGNLRLLLHRARKNFAAYWQKQNSKKLS